MPCLNTASVIALTFSILANVLIYIDMAYLGTLARASHKISANFFILLNLTVAFVYSISILLFGFISDYCNKQKLILSAICLITLSAYPLLKIAIEGNMVSQLISQMLLAVLIGCLLGPLASLAAKSFPVIIRYTALGVLLNISASFFGGTAPVICSWLTRTIHSPLAPAYYAMFFGLLSITAYQVSTQQKLGIAVTD